MYEQTVKSKKKKRKNNKPSFEHNYAIHMEGLKQEKPLVKCGPVAEWGQMLKSDDCGNGSIINSVNIQTKLLTKPCKVLNKSRDNNMIQLKTDEEQRRSVLSGWFRMQDDFVQNYILMLLGFDPINNGNRRWYTFDNLRFIEMQRAVRQYEELVERNELNITDWIIDQIAGVNEVIRWIIDEDRRQAITDGWYENLGDGGRDQGEYDSYLGIDEANHGYRDRLNSISVNNDGNGERSQSDSEDYLIVT